MRATREEIRRAYARVKSLLLREKGARPNWVGQLSPSALSTATAVSALCLADRAGHDSRIERGLAWLARTQNSDGGWGDTAASRSNVATSYLALAAFQLAGRGSSELLRRASTHVEAAGGLDAVIRRYGKDKTFSAPILANLAIAGQIEWHDCPQLPFWLAALPKRLYPRLGLHVVSYALPALIAVGLARWRNDRSRNPLAGLTVQSALRLLERITPESGGYLEATPLTSFVAMGLIAAGERNLPSLRRNIAFLVHEQSEDGSWKIDRDLAVWVTSLSVSALGGGDAATRDWLLAQQTKLVHPYTGSPPGGWGWTDSSGSVPDVDDTAGALLALSLLPEPRRCITAAANGVQWLLDLQNDDGGWPTFCRGWRRLPFDQSAPDLTAHALRALVRWCPWLPAKMQHRIETALRKGLAYLDGSQRPDGSWAPLWFGNEAAPGEENPVYGTARVLAAYRELRQAEEAAERGVEYLVGVQNADGSWGGAAGVAGSVEETALACDALAGLNGPRELEAVERGIAWLCQRANEENGLRPAPIGLYFAKLWYSERLYPMIFAVSALRNVCEGQSTSMPQAVQTSPASWGRP